MSGRRVAVIGSGVSGLTAAYLLQKSFDVTLFEADDRLGGHAHTHEVAAGTGGTLAVDSGFIVHNQRTYPYLLRLFGELGVRTQPAQMSMSIRCDGCGLEYAGGRGASGLFASLRASVKPAYLRLLGEVTRFHRNARRTLEAGDNSLTLREFLVQGDFSAYFTSHFMVPVVSAVWSTAPAVALDYPASYLFAFLDNHGMLSIKGSPTWRTVVGGSRVYVERAVKNLSAVEMSAPVRSLRRHADGIEIRDEGDRLRPFDSVVIATHADTALSLLEDPTPEELSVLGAFPYSHNDTVLHTDVAVLPKSRRARSSWNYLLPSCSASSDRVLVSYDMNLLQRLAGDVRYVVSLNADERIDPARVLARMRYDHPLYTTGSVAAQAKLPGLSTRVVAYAGSYHGWGFHEDGCRSGVAAAANFGVDW